MLIPLTAGSDFSLYAVFRRFTQQSRHMKTSPFAAFLFAALTCIPSSRAVTAAAGDLIPGFKAAAGMGADINLEVNPGPASDFYGAAAGSTAVLTKLAVADLVDTYGADWNTRCDLFWGIAGTTGVAAVNGVPARTTVTGLKASLPRASKNAPAKKEESKMKAITVNNQGQILMDNARVTLPDLEARLKAHKVKHAEFPVIIKGDSATPYQVVVDVLELVHRLGITQIGLPTKGR